MWDELLGLLIQLVRAETTDWRVAHYAEAEALVVLAQGFEVRTAVVINVL